MTEGEGVDVDVAVRDELAVMEDVGELDALTPIVIDAVAVALTDAVREEVGVWDGMKGATATPCQRMVVGSQGPVRRENGPCGLLIAGSAVLNFHRPVAAVKNR